MVMTKKEDLKIAAMILVTQKPIPNEAYLQLKELEKRISVIVDEAFSAGYRERDSEIILSQIQ